MLGHDRSDGAAWDCEYDDLRAGERLADGLHW